MSLDTLSAVLGWSLLINSGFYLLWLATIMFARDWLVARHSKWFGVAPERIPAILYGLLASYKLAILMLNFTPWLAIQIVR